MNGGARRAGNMCFMWASVALRGQPKRRVFQNWAGRKTLGPKIEEVIDGRKLRNEAVHDKHSPHYSLLDGAETGLLRPDPCRGELSYLAPLGSENISAPYFKQFFFRGGGITPPDSQTPRLPVLRQK